MTRISRPDSRCAAFSLIEILVAVSVLALLLTLLLQVVNGTMLSSKVANQQMDATAGTRRALDVMVGDLQNSIVGTTSTILGGTTGKPQLAMITQGRGPSGGASPRFLAVQYLLASTGTSTPDTLQRSYAAVNWTTSDLLAAAAATATTPTTLASGVLGFSVQAILENGDRHDVNTTPPPSQAWAISAGNPFPATSANAIQVPPSFLALVPATPPTPYPLNANTARVTALEITLVAVDEQNYRLLEKSGKLDAVRSGFAAPGNDLPAARWSQLIDSSSQIPPPVKTSMKVLSKTVPLP